MINITLATIFTGLITKDSSSKEYNLKLLNTNSKPHSPNLPKLDFTWIKTKYSNITGLAIDDEASTPHKYDALITIYPEEEVGTVRDDFYGVNVHASWLRKGKSIDKDGNGFHESLADTIWHRQVFLESGMRYVREDARIDSCYYVNSSNLSQWKRTCNLTNQLEEYEWAKQNGVRILNILSYMPVGLRNLSANCSSDPQKCEPLDYDIWGKILVDYINATTLEGYYLDIIDYEIWNEPDLRQFLQPNLPSGTHGTQGSADIYVKLYNASYTNIKAVYPNAVIIGPSSAHADIYTKITFSFLSNFSDKMDGISTHNYYPVDGKSVITRIQNTLRYCEDYNANCSRILMNEFNYKNKSGVGGGMELSNSRLSNYFADIFSDGLNLYPENLSLMIYQWSEAKKYLPNVSYPEYPSRWAMVSEPQLDNAYYPPYNITKDFAHYHAGGNIIVNSSSSNNSIKSVASLNPQGVWHITVINTGIDNLRVNLDVYSAGVEAVKDLATGIIYPVNNGVVNVGVLEEYDVKHYEGIVGGDIDKVVQVNEIDETDYKTETSTIGNKIVPLNEVLSSDKSNNKIISTRNIISDIKTSISKDKEAIEESESKVERNSLSSLISEVSMIEKNPIIIVTLLLSISIVTLIIIYIVKKRKKKQSPYNQETINKLEDWIKKARSLGYNNEKMKEMLRKSGWDTELVEEVVGS